MLFKTPLVKQHNTNYDLYNSNLEDRMTAKITPST